MADPTLITVTGQLREQPMDPDGSASISFDRPVFVQHPDGTVVEPNPQVFPVLADGTYSCPVMPSNHPDWTPQGWTYTITIFDGNRRYKYQAAIPYDVPGGTMTLPLPALTASQGAAYAPLVHGHPISQVAGLQPALDGKSPVGHTHGASDNILHLPEIAAPAPIADQLQIYAIDLDGNTVPRIMLPEGIEVDFLRDTSFVVRNSTGSTINIGTPVYATGIHPGGGNIPTVAPAKADALATSPVIGLMLETVPTNSYGRVMQQGRLNNVNTTGLTTGSPLYLSPTTAGAIVTAPPAHPNYTVPVGVAMRVHATLGTIAVQITSIEGNEQGTAQNVFVVGNALAGTKSIGFKNLFSSLLSANPTAARVWTLPDASGALVLAADLTAYLTKIAPLVTDTTFTVVRSLGGAARWRATGGALDIETVGDVIESSYPNQDFTGTQTPIRRIRAGSGQTLVGRTEFGTGPYAAEMAIDPPVGTAFLGAKNGLTNLGICGYKATIGAPTTGTWAVGDVVISPDGVWRCTAAGTPGTWSMVTTYSGYEPGDHNMIGWTFNPGDAAFGTTVVATSGLVRYARVKLLRPVLTNLHFHLTAGGASLTANQCFAAVYNDAGALLGPGAVTASLHNTGANGWGDGGFKTHPLNTPMGVEPGAWYKIAWWFNGTTGPTFTRASNSGSAIVNANLTAGTARFATANTGVTTTAPANLSGAAGDGTAWFVGAS